MWHRDKTWAKAGGRMIPIDLQGCHKPLICKKCNYLQSTVKWSAVKQGVPVPMMTSSSLD